MLRMFARRLGYVRTSTGADVVMFGISLPSDTVVHDIRVKVRGHSQSDSLVVASAHMMAYEMWLLPVLDPDLGDTYDDIWDALVPKDTDVQTLDLDTQALDTTPFYEPGEADWSAILDVGLRPERLYHRHVLQTIANAVVIYQDNQSPFSTLWVAGDSFNIHIKRRLRVRQPTALVLAVATPSFDDTTNTLQTALAENEWGQVKYASNMLERALMHLFGLTQAGAETPWEDATAILQKHLDPDVYEQSAGVFNGTPYEMFWEALIDHSVVGEIGKGQITTGR